MQPSELIDFAEWLIENGYLSKEYPASTLVARYMGEVPHSATEPDSAVDPDTEDGTEPES